MWQFFIFKVFLFNLNIARVLFFTADFSLFNYVFVSLIFASWWFAIFYNTVTLPWENLVSLTFSKIVKTKADWGLPSAFSSLINQRILFVELLLDQNLILFFYLNQLLLTYNDFWYIHNLIDIH